MKRISTLIQKSNNSIIKKISNQLKYVKYDYQSLGLELTDKLNDLEHKSLYMKLAKTTDERLLRNALSFSLDYNLKGGSRAKIFMWKLKELKKALKSKAENNIQGANIIINDETNK